MDFHAGSVTRPPTDVDLLVRLADKNKLHALLRDVGFNVIESLVGRDH